MKRNIKNILKIMILIALIAVILSGLSRVLENKSSRFNKEPLYRLSHDPDVIFAGASRMHNAIYPALLWEDYGIAAYNCASPGEQTGTTSYVLRQLLSDFSPKLVVFDMALVSDVDEVSWSHEVGYIHESMDFMPLNKNKLELAEKVADYNDMSPLAFLSNIYFYHERWKELSRDDFEVSLNRELGGEMLTRIAAYEAPEVFEPQTDEAVLSGGGYHYLDIMMRECEKNGADFMFINLPYHGDNERRQRGEYTMMEAVRERGGYTLDLLRSMDENGLDFGYDYADSGHVNIVGAGKLTKYVGEYLSREAELSDRRGDEAYSSWDEALSDYKYYKLDCAAKADGAAAFAMYACGEDEWELRAFEGAEGVLEADKNLMHLIDVCGGGIFEADEMSDEEAAALKTKYDTDPDIGRKRCAMFIEEKSTGRILAAGLFAYGSGFVSD